MKTIIYASLLALVMLISSCNLYRHYESRPLDYDASQLVAGDSTTAPLCAMSWRQLFSDPCLTSLIDNALSSNTDLRIAQLRVDETAATLRASKLAFLPSAKLGVEGSVAKDSPSRLQIGPSASWEVDIFGRQRNLKMGAQADFYASMAYRQAVQTALIASVAECYYTLLMLDEQLNISERTITTWDENIRVLQALKRAGRTNEAAVLQARANRMKVETSALTLRNQIFSQENALRSLLLNPDISMTRGQLADVEFPDTLSCGLALELLSNRPDVRQAEFELQRSFYDINVARAAFYPSLTLSGNLGWSTSSGSSVVNPSAWIANALGSLTAPLFNRGTNTANLIIARKNHEIAALNFQQRLLDAGMEVNDALSDWQTARQRLLIDKKQIVALKGAVHNTRLLMRNTNTNYLEVLTAQQRLLEAELTEASDRYAEIEAIIALYHVLGGGVQ